MTKRAGVLDVAERGTKFVASATTGLSLPSVTIRGLSAEVLRALRATARARRRSLNAQVLAWLDEARQREQAQGDVENLLRAIDRHVKKTRLRRQTDSARLIRRMRDGR